MTQRCELTELLVSDCAHCRGLPDPEQAAEADGELGPWFTAGLPGACSGCGGRIYPGDRIRATGDGGYLAQCCGGNA